MKSLLILIFLLIFWIMFSLLLRMFFKEDQVKNIKFFLKIIIIIGCFIFLVLNKM
jgi:hypothetical protein